MRDVRRIPLDRSTLEPVWERSRAAVHFASQARAHATEALAKAAERLALMRALSSRRR